MTGGFCLERSGSVSEETRFAPKSDYAHCPDSAQKDDPVILALRYM